MKCYDCNHFAGQDPDDGGPICEYDGDCPLEELGEMKTEADKGTISVSIDSAELALRVSSAFNSSVTRLVDAAINAYMREEYEKRIRSMTEAELEKRVIEQVDVYMQETVSIGGGWNEPMQELSRTDYLNQTIKKILDKDIPQDKYEKELKKLAEQAIEKWAYGAKKSINDGIASTFNEITRQNLTDNIVSMLMNSDSYRQLSGSVQALLK